LAWFAAGARIGLRDRAIGCSMGRKFGVCEYLVGGPRDEHVRHAHPRGAHILRDPLGLRRRRHPVFAGSDAAGAVVALAITF
jgi:hypothetical protein